VSGYLVGVIGSSNNRFRADAFDLIVARCELALGVSGTGRRLAGWRAAVVCVSSAVAGELLQD